MACCSVALASAQLNGDGFYRVQNSTSTRYITVIDNKSKGVDACRPRLTCIPLRL